MFSGIKARPARKDDNLTACYGDIIIIFFCLLCLCLWFLGEIESDVLLEHSENKEASLLKYIWGDVSTDWGDGRNASTAAGAAQCKQNQNRRWRPVALESKQIAAAVSTTVCNANRDRDKDKRLYSVQGYANGPSESHS
jgi:hypothetical protein